MNRRPTLALLIPAYNAETHLPRLLRSAADQSEPFDEILVYDDCSTDRTPDVAAHYGARVVRGEINRGCTWGKSVLVGRTSCDWVHFHDADDLLLPGFVGAAHRWMAADDADVIIFRCEERWEAGGALNSVSEPDDEALRADAIGYAIRQKINASSELYRRSCFNSDVGFDLDPEVLYNEDQAFHCKIARSGLRFRGDRAVTVVYFRQRASMSNANPAKCLRAHYHVMSKALAHSSGRAHSAEIAERLWQVAAGAASFLDWETADRASALAMKLAAPSGRLFHLLCGVSPSVAIRIREALVRLLKPKFRVGHPGWRAPISLF